MNSDEILIWDDVPAERLFLCRASDVIPIKVLKESHKKYLLSDKTNIPFSGGPEKGGTSK